ncbi:MAG: hypothetical protein HGGPFJEG_01645 [Ignavibacteria bacterium]|nr:hypothetical protein [Ignavibacteria bacterium]
MKNIFYKLNFVIVFSVCCLNCGNDNLNEEIKIKKNKDKLKSETHKIDDSSPKSEFAFSSESISPAEAKNHIGDSITVHGYVADVYVSEKVAYLNFDNKFPKNTFTCTIFKKYFTSFGDLTGFKNKNVLVTGKISIYKNKPQMILYFKHQIKILGE